MLKIQLLKPGDYYTQRKNEGTPAVECQVTAGTHWLLAQDIRPETDGKRLPDYIDDYCQSEHAFDMAKAEGWKGNPRELHSVLCWAINEAAGREIDRFDTDVTMPEILFEIARNRPVIVAGTFGTYVDKKGKTQPRLHVTCLTGLVSAQEDIEQVESPSDIALNLIASVLDVDSWGDLHTNYRNHIGYECHYSLSELGRILHAENEELKWAHRRVA